MGRRFAEIFVLLFFVVLIRAILPRFKFFGVFSHSFRALNSAIFCFLVFSFFFFFFFFFYSQKKKKKKKKKKKQKTKNKNTDIKKNYNITNNSSGNCTISN